MHSIRKKFYNYVLFTSISFNKYDKFDNRRGKRIGFVKSRFSIKSMDDIEILYKNSEADYA